jgi:flagella basal body P-ring formation protein FlgA
VAVTEASAVTTETTHVDSVARPETVRPVRARRSRTYLAGALALIVAGGLGSAFLYTSASHTEQVLVVAHDLQRGQVITATDLTTIGIAHTPQTQGIPAADSTGVVGKTATVDLPRGSLLTGRSFAGSLSVPSGRALVGLALKPSQLPAQPLVAGDHVVIVPVAADRRPAPVTTDTVTGTVSDTAGDKASGATIIDVYVSQTIAADLTSRAASGTVAIYLTGSEK